MSKNRRKAEIPGVLRRVGSSAASSPDRRSGWAPLEDERTPFSVSHRSCACASGVLRPILSPDHAFQLRHAKVFDPGDRAAFCSCLSDGANMLWACEAHRLTRQHLALPYYPAIRKYAPNTEKGAESRVGPIGPLRHLNSHIAASRI